MSLVDQQAKDYINILQKLRCNLCEHASVSAAVLIHRVCGEIQAIGRAIPPYFNCCPMIIDVRCRGAPTPE